jgi:WD40 repeat protein
MPRVSGGATPAATASITRLDARHVARLDGHVEVLRVDASGRRIVAGSLAGDGVLLVDGEILRPTTPHPMGMLAAGWSSDGSLLATGGADGMLHLGTTEHDLAAHRLDGWVNTIAWSPVASLLACGHGSTVSVFDIGADGSARCVVTHVLPSTVTAVAWTPDVRRLGAAAYGGIWWFEPGRTDGLLRTFPWKGALLSLHVAASGRWAGAGRQDASAHVWRLWPKPTGRPDDLPMSGYSGKIRHVAFDPTSTWFAIGDVGDVSLWNLSGRGPQGTTPRQLVGQAGRITSLGWRGDRLLSSADDGSICVWRPSSSGRAMMAKTALDEAVSAVAWCTDDRIVAVTGGGGLALVDLTG